MSELPPAERPLAGLAGARPEPPEWLRDLRLEPDEALSVEVEGAAIEVLAWGEHERPGVLLAHGARAHARWWGAVAPMLAQDFRVASLSWSGMGGSGWREGYSIDLQVEELLAAARIAGLFDGSVRPVVIGHSFGARAVAWAMAKRGYAFGGAVLVDSAVMPNRWPALDAAVRDPRYPTLEAALARFNLRPPQPCANLFLLDAIARASLEPAGDEWRWRFDPAYYAKYTYGDVWPAIAAPRGPLAFVYGTSSLTTDAGHIAAQRKQAPAGTPFVPIVDAGHHIMLDQPVALTAALSALVQAWLL